MPTDNLTTSLHAAVQRIADDLMEQMATDGLTALKQTLDDAGASERLKQYEVFSHVSGDSVVFEIVVDSSKVVATDAKTMKAIQTESSKLRQDMMKRVSKSFEMGPEGPRRVVRDARRFQSDARKPSGDARKPARDARRPSTDARLGVGSVVEDPRGLDLTPDGKLSITLERSATTGKSGFKMPKDAFQGIMGDFMNRLNDAVVENFAGKLQDIISRRT